MLEQLRRDRYPLEVIRQKPLPDGVDPTKLEYYLSDEDFKVFLVDF
jgi:supervillin